MSSQHKPGDKKERGDSHFGYTVPGALYDRHGPIPVADALEKDTDSAWALFEESVMRQDNPDSQLERPEVNPDDEGTPEDEHADFEPTRQGNADFAPTDLGGEFYDSTRAAPLKP